ncbi:MAG: ribosome small subunit-dependent GTPase A [Bacilli bacterium]
MPQGRITKALSGFYYVWDGNETYQCRARGLFRKKNESPLVGDEVEFEAPNLTDGYVMSIGKRKNELVRPPIANVDIAFLVFSVVEPDFSTSLLDRFLALVEFNEIEPIIVLTKTDLLTPKSSTVVEKYIEDYRNLGYTLIDAHGHLENMPSLKSYLAENKGQTIVLAGQSGVGKSTLLNALDDTLNIKTNEISNALGRGKHTTRHVELISVANNFIADTPGFSSLELPMDKIQLTHCFSEMVRYSDECRFRGCTHTKEPGCALLPRYESGELPSYRYKNYLTFLQEITDRKPRY